MTLSTIVEHDLIKRFGAADAVPRFGICELPLNVWMRDIRAPAENCCRRG